MPEAVIEVDGEQVRLHIPADGELRATPLNRKLPTEKARALRDRVLAAFTVPFGITALGEEQVLAFGARAAVAALDGRLVRAPRKQIPEGAPPLGVNL